MQAIWLDVFRSHFTPQFYTRARTKSSRISKFRGQDWCSLWAMTSVFPKFQIRSAATHNARVSYSSLAPLFASKSFGSALPGSICVLSLACWCCRSTERPCVLEQWTGTQGRGGGSRGGGAQVCWEELHWHKNVGFHNVVKSVCTYSFFCCGYILIDEYFSGTYALCLNVPNVRSTLWETQSTLADAWLKRLRTLD
jgi:hypothetical protein